MDVSILIATYNRAPELQRTLEGMRTLRFPDGVTFEILVIDNNSTDATKDVAGRFQQDLPVRYFLEKRPGQSNAQNHGIEAARGELVIFTDDDVDVTPEWAAEIYKAALEYPDAGFFGGRVITSWQASPPDWLTENLDWVRTPTTYEGGDEAKYLTDNKALFVGANMAFRRRILQEGFRFRTDFGPMGDNRLNSARHGGQDGEFQERVMAKGYRGLYVPSGVLHHREAVHRMTRRYLRWWSREAGRESRRRDGIEGLNSFWFGVPRYLWRVYIGDLIGFGSTRLARSSRVWLRAECKLAGTVGDMMECRFQYSQRKIMKRSKAGATGGIPT